MKLAIIAVVAFAALAQGFVLPIKEEVTGNVIDNLVLNALEFLRKLLKQNEPLALPEIPEQTIVDTDVNLKVQVTGVKLSKADDFAIEHVENDLTQLTAKFQFKAPEPHIDGQYTVSGTLFGKTVNGQGAFNIDLVNFDLTGDVVNGFQNHGLIIKGLSGDYTLDGAKIDITGLQVEGMTPEEVNDFLNKQLLDILNQHKQEVCQKVAAQLMEKTNDFLANKTLKDLIEAIKNLVPQ